MSGLVARENSENFWMGRYYSVPLGKFLNGLKIYKISNLGIPVSFLGLRQDGKWPVLKWASIRQVLNAREKKFPTFSGKKFGTQKTRMGMKTSIGAIFYHESREWTKTLSVIGSSV